ncbi:unnamed protein product [Bathycoccus prasinos]
MITLRIAWACPGDVPFKFLPYQLSMAKSWSSVPRYTCKLRESLVLGNTYRGPPRVQSTGRPGPKEYGDLLSPRTLEVLHRIGSKWPAAAVIPAPIAYI